MNFGKKVQLAIQNEIQGLFTKFSNQLNGALEQIQEECNRQDERITDVEKSLESLRAWNNSRMNCLLDKQNDTQAAVENFEQKFVKFNALLLDASTQELRLNELMLKVETLEKTVESLNRSVTALSENHI